MRTLTKEDFDESQINPNWRSKHELGGQDIFQLEDFHKNTINILREKYSILSSYTDDEIVKAYSFYCDLFYGAQWTEVDYDGFIQWSTISPLDSYK